MGDREVTGLKAKDIFGDTLRLRPVERPFIKREVMGGFSDLRSAKGVTLKGQSTSCLLKREIEFFQEAGLTCEQIDAACKGDIIQSQQL